MLHCGSQLELGVALVDALQRASHSVCHHLAGEFQIPRTQTVRSHSDGQRTERSKQPAAQDEEHVETVER